LRVSQTLCVEALAPYRPVLLEDKAGGFDECSNATAPPMLGTIVVATWLQLACLELFVRCVV